MTTAIFKVYGRNGDDQRVASRNSAIITRCDGRQFALINADITGTKEYAVVIVKGRTVAECRDNMRGQLLDGIFEGVPHGRAELVH